MAKLNFAHGATRAARITCISLVSFFGICTSIACKQKTQSVQVQVEKPVDNSAFDLGTRAWPLPPADADAIVFGVSELFEAFAESPKAMTVNHQNDWIELTGWAADPIALTPEGSPFPIQFTITREPPDKFGLLEREQSIVCLMEDKDAWRQLGYGNQVVVRGVLRSDVRGRFPELRHCTIIEGEMLPIIDAADLVETITERKISMRGEASCISTEAKPDWNKIVEYRASVILTGEVLRTNRDDEGPNFPQPIILAAGDGELPLEMIFLENLDTIGPISPGDHVEMLVEAMLNVEGSPEVHVFPSKFPAIVSHPAP